MFRETRDLTKKRGTLRQQSLSRSRHVVPRLSQVVQKLFHSCTQVDLKLSQSCPQVVRKLSSSCLQVVPSNSQVLSMQLPSGAKWSSGQVAPSDAQALSIEFPTCLQSVPSGAQVVSIGLHSCCCCCYWYWCVSGSLIGNKLMVYDWTSGPCGLGQVSTAYKAGWIHRSTRL